MPRARGSHPTFIDMATRELSLVALVTVGVAGMAHADSYAPPSKDAQATALFKAKDVVKSNFAAPGLKYKVGHAEIFVDAPMRHVRDAVVDVGNYQTIIPRFEKSTVLSKNDQAVKAFLKVPILHGAASFWAVENFSSPAVEGKGEKVVGAMEKGNMEDFRATWRYRPVDAGHTIVSLDLYLAPKLDVSDALVAEEERDAAADGVRGIKTRAETVAKQLASTP